MVFGAVVEKQGKALRGVAWRLKIETEIPSQFRFTYLLSIISRTQENSHPVSPSFYSNSPRLEIW